MHFRSAAEEGGGGRTCSAERTLRSRDGEQTLPVNGLSVLRLLLLARRLPTGCARTKGNVHGARIQSPVMQKS
ncbi:uncharacterized protein V6R79_023030 [Siganus canaliculatus]